MDRSGRLDQVVETDRFVLPDYGGVSLADILEPLLGQVGLLMGDFAPPSWFPHELERAEQVVLLVVDGLGYFQLLSRLNSLPGFSSMQLRRGSSVAPTTTATALTSLTTGCSPAEHGLVGYRIRIGPGEVLNTLRWTLPATGKRGPQPAAIQSKTPFFGVRPVVITKAVHSGTGFTEAHLRSARLQPWKTVTGIVSGVIRALGAGEQFIYAYYDGVDTTAHETGLGSEYDLELTLVDLVVQMLIARLTPGVALIITSDHGQVEVRDTPIRLPATIAGSVRFQSGEGRFRWLHTQRGQAERVAKELQEAYADKARVFTRSELLNLGVFGGPMEPLIASRLGDVAIIATQACAFYDPTDTGSMRLISMHGGLTAAEMIVPILWHLQE
ncbi:MAG: alkaline phosphatase family protein [Ferrimicrobium sp.]